MTEIIDFFREYSSIIIPAFTFMSIVTAIIIFKKAWKRTNIVDQKSSIISIINDIQSCPVNIEFGYWRPHETGGGGGSGNMYKLTLFEIGDLLEKDPIYSDYDSEQVFFAKGTNQIIELKKHINNPLTPKNISNALNKFYNSHFDKVNYKDIKSELKYVKIETGNFKENMFNKKSEDSDFKLGNGLAYKSYLSFKTCCNDLEKAITSWKERNNVPIQIRKDKNSY